MHKDKGIFHTHRWLCGLSKIPDNSKTLTFQSTDTKNSLRKPLHGPVAKVSCIIIIAPFINSIVENYHIEVMNKFYNIVYDD